MNYMRRSPCQKYSEKQSNKEELRKSLSATKFVPFTRRPSDTTSESGSDDFKMEIAEDVSSSFSRSSSDSYTFGVAANNRYQCIRNLKDLSESTHLDEDFDKEMMKPNESLDDFRSRMNSRRKVKTRYQDSQEDDKTDNSCDSATTKAHEEILRNANLLKQEQVSNTDGGYGQMKSYHREIHSYKLNSNNNKISNARNDDDDDDDDDAVLGETDETILMNEFDAILTMEENKLNEYNDDVFQPSVSNAPKTISRSKTTENFLAKKSEDKKSAASPRFRRKTHMLKAASSIPSLIFPNKSSKQKSTSTTPTSTTNTFDYTLSPSGKFDVLKKNSIDEDVFNISVTKARRSPLRILGNLVDDKIFRGRWSTAKRAKSTDEITWALANEGAASNMQNEMRKRSGSTKPQNRKKSFAGLLGSSNSDNNNNNNNSMAKKQYKSLSDKFRNSTDSNTSEFSINTNVVNKAKPKLIEISKRKPSNSYTEVLTISDSSLASLNDSQSSNRPSNIVYNVSKRQHIPNNEIRAETLAEIEAFEKMLETHLQE
ncbi:LOW QUALITY PROTEIN: uncharacterized protein LOC124492439 [Dermatophagoides farinae]|uniref:Uncharacterized protein n=1 Tax=Dermatophagoides farinae TaxID=6954 RepID=A0A922IH62_DERFA|nr:hypothetical protein DERF_003427 [Dermatophagoides farinae]